MENESYLGCALPEKTELAIPEPVHGMYSMGNDLSRFHGENSRGQCSRKTETTPLGNNKDEWSSGWKNSSFHGGNDWGQCTTQTGTPLPGTNEDEWSDGWK